MTDPGYNVGMAVPPDNPSTRPSGRDEIKAALIQSTLELIESHGLSVSIREIAERADVPHSLIGRYFGSKTQLIQAAIDSTLPPDVEAAAGLTTARDAITAVFETGFERPERIRILVHLLQDGMSPRTIRQEAPMINALAELLEADPPQGGDPRLVTAATVALAMGWLLAEDYLVTHAGLEDQDLDKVRSQVEDLAKSWL